MTTIAKVFAASLMLLPMLTWADVPQWQIVPNESKLSFTATQNNAPVKGSFTSLHGTIDFSPDDLKQSKIDIVVDMSSVNASYQELVSTLKMSDWLDVTKFKEATFRSKDVTKVKNNIYQAKGELQIRDKKLPLTVEFTVNDYKKDKFYVKGETKIKRSAYGVGQGEWTSTDEIKDEVTVTFDLSIKPKESIVSGEEPYFSFG